MCSSHHLKLEVVHFDFGEMNVNSLTEGTLGNHEDVSVPLFGGSSFAFRNTWRVTYCMLLIN